MIYKDYLNNTNKYLFSGKKLNKILRSLDSIKTDLNMGIIPSGKHVMDLNKVHMKNLRLARLLSDLESILINDSIKIEETVDSKESNLEDNRLTKFLSS